MGLRLSTLQWSRLGPRMCRLLSTWRFRQQQYRPSSSSRILQFCFLPSGLIVSEDYFCHKVPKLQSCSKRGSVCFVVWPAGQSMCNCFLCRIGEQQGLSSPMKRKCWNSCPGTQVSQCSEHSASWPSLEAVPKSKKRM